MLQIPALQLVAVTQHRKELTSCVCVPQDLKQKQNGFGMNIPNSSSLLSSARLKIKLINPFYYMQGFPKIRHFAILNTVS